MGGIEVRGQGLGIGKSRGKSIWGVGAIWYARAMAKKTSAKKKAVGAKVVSAGAMSVEEVIAELRAMGSPEAQKGMARFGIGGETASRAFGVRGPDIRALAKRIGRDHELAQELFKSGWYDAQILAAFIGEPSRLTPAMMNRWAKAFDNWATCDTACFHLFDRGEPSLAFAMVREWAERDEEFVKRAAFALLAGLAQHNKTLPDREFEFAFAIIEKAADDPRNFVKKGVNWALRGIGERSPGLLAKAKKASERLAKSESSAARWVGKDALREFARREQKRLTKRV